MDIAIYIAELLRNHDEVSVTGLGTFVKQRINGYYDPKNQYFIPPSHSLSFKSNDTENSLLVDYLTRYKDISALSASYFIQKYARKLNDLIATSGYIHLNQLGVLRKTEEEYHFEASDEFGSASFYGLKPVSEQHNKSTSALFKSDKPYENPLLPPPDISTKVLEQGEIQTMTFPPASHAETEQSQADEIATSSLHKIMLREEEEVVEIGPEESSGFKIIRNIALVVAAAGLIFFVLAYFFYPGALKVLFEPETVIKKIITEEKHAPLPVPEALIESEAEADSVYNALQSQHSDVKDSIATAEVVLPQNSQPKYEIIAASLNSEAEAKKIVKNFEAMGLSAKIIYVAEKKRNNVLVSIGSFLTLTVAKEELINIKKKIEKDAYLYTNPIIDTQVLDNQE